MTFHCMSRCLSPLSAKVGTWPAFQVPGSSSLSRRSLENRRRQKAAGAETARLFVLTVADGSLTGCTPGRKTSRCRCNLTRHEVLMPQRVQPQPVPEGAGAAPAECSHCKCLGPPGADQPFPIELARHRALIGCAQAPRRQLASPHWLPPKGNVCNSRRRLV